MILKDLSNLMNVSTNFNNLESLREIIKKNIELKDNNNLVNINNVDFVNKNISIKSLDYYHTNSIARSSKVMSDCKQISKNFLFTGIEKAS